MSHIDSVNQEACAQLLRLCYSVSTLRRLPIYVRSTLTLRKLLFGCYCNWKKPKNLAADIAQRTTLSWEAEAASDCCIASRMRTVMGGVYEVESLLVLLTG